MFISVVELFFCVYALLQSCEADVCNVGFHSELATKTECFTTFGDCGFDSLQARHPTLYNKTGWRRDPPSNIKLTSFCEPNSLGENHSGINVHWNLPNSQSAAGIAGYELRVEGDPPNFRCLVVMLEEKATPKNIHLVLNSTMYPVRRNQNYMIVLHSLPRTNNSEPESKHVISMKCKRGSTSSNWAPAGHNYSYKWPEKILVVWFPAPPSEFNINKFKLDLFPANNGKTQEISNTTEVMFRDVEPGKYNLYMQPYNEHPHDKNLCVCRDDENRCKICKLSMWSIAVKLPKTSPSTASKDQGHEITVGLLCASVVLAILLFLLYKLLARRFGIECVIGKSSKSGKDDILHVMCVDVMSTRQKTSKLRFILENGLNTRLKFSRVIAKSEEDISSNMSSLWKKWKIRTSSSECSSDDVTNKPVVTVNILICLLTSNVKLEKISGVLSKVHSNILKNKPLCVQICAVTFADDFDFPQSAPMKCFALNVDQQTFLNAIKKAFPKQTNDQDTSVRYTCGTNNSSTTAQHPDKHQNSRDYVALTESDTENTDHVLGHDDTVIKGSNNQVPEIMYLGVPEQRRERYVSNDSGRGGSVLSYKEVHLPDDLSGLWQEADVMSSKIKYQGRNGDTDRYQLTRTDCPSCDISFFPPDPSVISENDLDPNDVDSDIVDVENEQVYSIQNVQKKNCSNASSMDSLIEKMAQINERSARIMQQCSKLEDVHSVWEGHV